MPREGTSYLSFPRLRRVLRVPACRGFVFGSVVSAVRRSLAMMVLVVASGPRASSRVPAPPLQRFHMLHRAMGTEFALDVFASDGTAAEQVSTLAFEEIDRLEALLSNYRPTSELSRISREAAAAPVTTDPETFAFLERSMFWSRQSAGGFDITVGPLLRAWGFFFHSGRIPSAAELARLRERVGWSRVQLDPMTRSVHLLSPGPMELDPGSIGKGFAVDHVVALLREQGVGAAFVSAGNSTLYGVGAPPGSAGWPVQIPDPDHAGRTLGTIWLKDSSLSTGACTEKFFVRNGHRFCHIFDPRTMRPVEGMLQTTVLDRSATDSDAFSTVVFVLPPEASRALVVGIPGRAALLFPRAGTGTRCVAINWPERVCDRFRGRRSKEFPS